MPELSQREINRFWQKVDRTGECWLWTGSRGTNGYGRVSIRRVIYPTHRIAYELTFGSIPKGQMILHQCDTPACCRPEHLIVGTHADNMRDMARKGRHGLSNNPEKRSSGERNGQAVLTWEKIREIRAKYATGRYKKRALAREYGVSWFTVWDIIAGNRWKED